MMRVALEVLLRANLLIYSILTRKLYFLIFWRLYFYFLDVKRLKLLMPLIFLFTQMRELEFELVELTILIRTLCSHFLILSVALSLIFYLSVSRHHILSYIWTSLPPLCTHCKIAYSFDVVWVLWFKRKI